MNKLKYNKFCNIKTIKYFSLIAVILFFSAFILMFPASSAEGVRIGIRFSVDIIIPSLFPFMVISTFIVKSDIAAKIGRRIEKITQLIFKLPGCAGTTILMGLIGGYPTGARGIKALLEKDEINLNQARRMVYFLVGSGPAFVISVVGAKLLGSTEAGVILFFSQVIGALGIGLLLGAFTKNQESPKKKGLTKSSPCNISSALVESCVDSTRAMIEMSSFVVLFSTILRILNDSGVIKDFIDMSVNLGLPENISVSIIPIFLEVMSGCSIASQLHVAPDIISFALAWGGICVHFQIWSSLSNIKFSKLKFIFFRLIHGVLAFYISNIGFKIFPQTRIVFNSINSKLIAENSTSAIGTTMLIFMCLFFLTTMSFEKKFSR